MRERQVVHHRRVTGEQAGDIEVVRADGEKLAVYGAHQYDVAADRPATGTTALLHQLYAGHGRVDINRFEHHQQRVRGRRQPGFHPAAPVPAAAAFTAGRAGFLFYQFHDAVPRPHDHCATAAAAVVVRHQVQRGNAFAVQFHGPTGTAAASGTAFLGRRVLGEAADQGWRSSRRHHGRVRRKVQLDLHDVPGAGAAVHVLVSPVDHRAQNLAFDLGERPVQPLDVPLLLVQRPQSQHVVAGH